jgi:hypothetical protein
MEKTTSKRPDFVLWIICRYLLIVTPMSISLLVIGAEFGLPVNPITVIISGFISDRILTMYEHLDFEVTTHVMENDD